MLPGIRKKWLRALLSGVARADPHAVAAGTFAGRDDTPRALDIAERGLKRRWSFEVADFAVDAAIELRDFDRAIALCDLARPHDAARTFECIRSFAAETRDALSREEYEADPRLCLFGDTDHRVNIGCRLTSKTFKAFLRDHFGVWPTSAPYLFGKPDPSGAGTSGIDPHGAPRELIDKVARNFGADAVRKLADAQTIVFQPEGTLASKSSKRMVEGFFSPITLAKAWNKTVLMANGTVPGYDDERDALVRQALAQCDRHAMRDEISAERYSSQFVPDVAFAYRPATPVASSMPDGCLITTGARNKWPENHRIARVALDLCRRHGLRPVMMTKNVRHLFAFQGEVEAMGGIFAETASLPLATEIVQNCRLHVGGRYHSAILSADCGVPSALFNVDTAKNRWLNGFVDAVQLVANETEVESFAAQALSAAPAHRQDHGVEAKLAAFLSGISLSGSRPA